ncbi:MAG: universal stress protein [Saprospiraceae bacterium]
MLKRILVPTDFSENARHACVFAQSLAKTIPGATLRLVHVFMPNIETEYPTMSTPVVDHLRVREDMLNEFADEMGEKERELLVGFAADELVRMSESYDIIIMGTTGEGGVLSQWFGSVSSAVAQRAVCPVLLIPPDCTYRGFQQILYASSYDSVDKKMISKLLNFNNVFNATVHFVHVRDTADENAFVKTKEEIFRKLFADGEPTFAFNMAEVDADSVQEGLSDYATEHRINLVAMAHRQRGFWEGFFHRSQTKGMVLNAKNIPLLIFHLQSES